MKLSSIKRTATVVLVGSLCVGALALAGCSGQPSASSAASAASSSVSASVKAESGTKQFSEDELLTGKHHAVMTVEGYEPITLELDADAAPITVTNFADLVNQGYYDGKTFYRIVEDFCLQGGTLGNNAAGNDPQLETITGEFSDNGSENPLADQFDRGTVAMARTNLPNSATSTFFVTLGTNDQVGASLDGKYAAFGTIDEAGMAIIDAIVADYAANVDEPQMGAISDEAAQPIITSIEWVD
ncbi:peptidylprolyl isomerase [Adlercreutzia murintestinalis]|uniref:peptidylprolyl isomerase n=1 Tax=Adlercreutzia murintestinalis TaxID=2941325 RepID=UPI00203BC0AD|nr:peptidylprolyl isomerase [Adlercreutzia murintestinalis]